MNVHNIDENVRPSIAVLHAVAAHSKTPVRELKPLYDAIDPEALDELVNKGPNACIAFDYYSLRVLVDSDLVLLE